jgi:hypothetical protein
MPGVCSAARSYSWFAFAAFDFFVVLPGCAGPLRSAMNNSETDISGLKISGFRGNKSWLFRSRKLQRAGLAGPKIPGRGRALTERTGRNKIFYAVYKKAKDQSKSVADSTCDVSVNWKTRFS